MDLNIDFSWTFMLDLKHFKHYIIKAYIYLYNIDLKAKNEKQFKQNGLDCSVYVLHS